MLVIRRVDNDMVPDCMPFIVDYLDEATSASNSEIDTETVGSEILSGALDLWLIYDNKVKRLVGCVTTGFLAYPLKWAMEIRTLTVHAPREEWAPLFEELEQWAALHGCETIEMMGRRGWAKALPPLLGFEEVHVKMAKRVGHG